MAHQPRHQKPIRPVKRTRTALRRLKRNPEKRESLRQRISRYLDIPMSLISVLLVLIAILLLSGKTNATWTARLLVAQWILWALFALEFLIKLVLSPRKTHYLRRHWPDVIVVIFPFIGFLRLLAAIPPIIRLIVVGPWDVEPYLRILRRRKLGKLIIISAIVLLIAATLEYLFEAGARGATIHSFGDAVWWAAATVTTIANELYPVTPGGEIVAFLLMLYAVGFFSYLTSSLVSVLVGGDAQRDVTAAQGAEQERENRILAEVKLTQEEVEALRAILERVEQAKQAQ